MDYSIKRLTKADLHLAKQLFLFFQADDGIKRPSLAPDKYLLELISSKNHHIFAAIDADGTTVAGGLTAYELPMFYKAENEMFLYEMAVKPEYRRKGIASALINHLKDFCSKRKVKVIFVGTEQKNLAAKELYLKTGASMEIIPWFSYQVK